MYKAIIVKEKEINSYDDRKYDDRTVGIFTEMAKVKGFEITFTKDMIRLIREAPILHTITISKDRFKFYIGREGPSLISYSTEFMNYLKDIQVYLIGESHDK